MYGDSLHGLEVRRVPLCEVQLCTFAGTGLSDFVPLVYGFRLFGYAQTIQQRGTQYYLLKGLILITSTLCGGASAEDITPKAKTNGTNRHTWYRGVFSHTYYAMYCQTEWRVSIMPQMWHTLLLLTMTAIAPNRECSMSGLKPQIFDICTAIYPTTPTVALFASVPCILLQSCVSEFPSPVSAMSH